MIWSYIQTPNCTVSRRVLHLFSSAFSGVALSMSLEKFGPALTTRLLIQSGRYWTSAFISVFRHRSEDCRCRPGSASVVVGLCLRHMHLPSASRCQLSRERRTGAEGVPPVTPVPEIFISLSASHSEERRPRPGSHAWDTLTNNDFHSMKPFIVLKWFLFYCTLFSLLIYEPTYWSQFGS